MIRFTNLTLSRGTKRLLEHADVTVHVGQKVGIVGANGSGKSTMLAALRGEVLPDEGTIDIPPRWIIAQVAQETPLTSSPAIEYVLDGDRELRVIEHELAVAGAAPSHADASAHGTALAELHHRFEAVGG